MYACSGVTRHPHFWQNDRGFSRATVVTRGWNGLRRQFTLQKPSPAASAGSRTGNRDLSTTSPALYQPSYPNPPCFLFCFFFFFFCLSLSLFKRNSAPFTPHLNNNTNNAVTGGVHTSAASPKRPTTRRLHSPKPTPMPTGLPEHRLPGPRPTPSGVRRCRVGSLPEKGHRPDGAHPANCSTFHHRRLQVHDPRQCHQTPQEDWATASAGAPPAIPPDSLL